jgi:hypothetical protein
MVPGAFGRVVALAGLEVLLGLLGADVELRGAVVGDGPAAEELGPGFCAEVSDLAVDGEASVAAPAELDAPAAALDCGDVEAAQPANAAASRPAARADDALSIRVAPR